MQKHERSSAMAAVCLTFLLPVSPGCMSDTDSSQGDAIEELAPVPAERDLVSAQLFLENAGRAEYSPDGRRVLFHRAGEDGRYDVFELTVESGAIECVTCASPIFAKRHAGNASYHPSGDIIAFQAEKGRYVKQVGHRALTHPGIGWHNDIWVARLNTREFVQVTDLPTRKVRLSRAPTSAVLHPHFSPDGKLLSWGQSRDKGHLNGWQNWEVVVAEFADTAGGLSVTGQRSYRPRNANREYYESDDFNRAGDVLLLSANLVEGQRPFGMDIYAFDYRRGQLEQLTHSLSVWDEAAIYSPDYDRIVWLSSRGYEVDAESGEPWWKGRADFWIMNANGSEARQLTYFNRSGTPEHRLVGGARVIPAYIEWHPDGRSLLASIGIQTDAGNQDAVVRLTLRP